MSRTFFRRVWMKIPRRQWFFWSITLFPLVILVCSVADGTLKMSSDDKGLTQHYGFWVIFITTPLIIFLTWRLYRRFLTVTHRLDQYCIEVSDEMRGRVQTLVRKHIRSLSLRERSSWILVFLIIVMFFWWLFNVVKTITPEQTYHHDVFDSYSHIFGFLSSKVYILLVFTFVYSIAIFIALHVTASMISILRFLFRNDILRIDLFHSDNCGGTSKFGNINLLILAIYSIFFAIDLSMYLTHRQAYLAIIASLVASSVLAIAQSMAAVYFIHMAVAKKKETSMDLLSSRLNKEFTLSLNGSASVPSDLLTIRNHVAGVHTYPYATGALTIVNIFRFAPAILAVIAFFAKK